MNITSRCEVKATSPPYPPSPTVPSRTLLQSAFTVLVNIWFLAAGGPLCHPAAPSASCPSACPPASGERPAVTTLLVTHPAGLAHDMGRGHPERPDRLRAIE